MPVETPDHYGGKPIPKDAIEIALAAEKKKEDSERENKEKETQGKAQGEAHSLDDFIYIPSIKLHFAKERSHLGKDWYDAHRELQSKGLKMPTIPQFIEVLKYLRANPTSENTRAYNEIIEVRDPWREEWFDAKFYTQGGELWVAYNHIVDPKGNVVAQENEKLEGHLMQDKTPGSSFLFFCISLEYWLNNPTKQGLPQENSEQGDLRYWHLKKDKVAKFYAGSGATGLNCSGDPSYSNPKLGVFACAEKLGGKQ